MTTSNLLKKLSMASAGAVFIALGTAGGAAQAFQIGSSAFGSGAVMESFEGLSAGSNINNQFNGYLVPGVSSPFTFASGVTLTGPIPNDFSQVLVGDFSIGNAYFGLVDNGFISSSSNLLDGTAYLGYNSSSSHGSTEFTFASDMLRVGGFVTSAKSQFFPYAANGMITLSAFDALNNLLETVSISSVDVSNWGSNFLGLENSSGIRKITLSGDYLVLDKLTFEAAAKSVPEPSSTLSVLALGAIGAGCVMKRKQQQKAAEKA